MWPILAFSLFVFALAVVYVIVYVLTYNAEPGPPWVSNPPGGGGVDASSATIWGAIVAAVASFVTSVSSLIGLALGWKKSKTETLKADLEVQKLQLELERTNFEMEKLRKPKKRK